MAKATLYKTPDCMGCRATESVLTKKLKLVEGVDFLKVDLSTDEDARQMILALGYRSAPVIITESGEHWGGFNPEKLKGLVTDGDA